MKKEISKKNPHVFLLLTGLVLVASILTYLVPAGNFDRVVDNISGQTVVVPGSFVFVEQTPIAPWNLPIKFFETISSQSVSSLIFFIFVIGASFEIIMQSGAIISLCGVVIRTFENKREWIIPVFVCLFSVFGFTMGLATASIVFVPIGIAVASALKFDSLTGMAMVMLGTNAGFAAGVYNPFSVGVAQSIAEVPLFSGAWIRWLLLIPLLISTSFYIICKAKKQEYENNEEQKEETLWSAVDDKTSTESFTWRKGLVLVFLMLTLAVIIIGTSSLEWKIREIATSFLILGIACGIVSELSANEICMTFVIGSKKMMQGVLAIGIASTMRTILTQGNILDTITYSLIGAVENLPSGVQLLGMFYANALLDPLITSGSAHATVVMPLMTNLADGLRLSRQSAVFAFQLGDGLMNLVSPISTTLTSCLAISGINYGKWAKYFFPLVGIYILIGTAFVLFAVFVGY